MGARSLVLFLLVLFPLAASAETPPTGTWYAGVERPALTPRVGAEVVGGYPSPDRRIVVLTFTKRNGETGLCSGLWLSTYRILTAAHCTCDDHDFRVSNDQDIRSGQAKWVSAAFVSRLSTRVCRGGSALGTDLALLELKARLETKKNVVVRDDYSVLQSIELLGSADSHTDELMIAGYGFEGANAQSSGLRREASTSVNSMFCTEHLSFRLGCAAMREFIVGADGRGVDTCAGDSGAPAYSRVGDQILPVGIVSRALPLTPRFGGPGNCGSGGIYTLLGRRSVIEWLKKEGVPVGRSSE